jgi:SAM-dependent methyltransferase
VRRVVYSPTANRLIYFDEKATPEFWETRWRAAGEPPPPGPRDEVVTVTTKYLSIGSRILEGGCGRANKVKALADAGFEAIGVDFAEDAVGRAQLYYPQLDIRQGDVRSLKFPDAYFDGYWSIGVIEHFWDGYDAILAEAHRVLRADGILFLTAPWLSPFRKYKARVGGYVRSDFNHEPEGFYQYALGRQEVSAQLARHGFNLMQWSGLAAEISLKQDMTCCRSFVGWLFGSRGSIGKRILRQGILVGLSPLFGHSFMAIARRARAVAHSP